MNNTVDVSPVRVCRKSGETTFTMTMGLRVSRQATLELPNKILSHLLDHFSKASRLALQLVETSWPGSWQLDHVLCEDMGQLVGRGVAAIHDDLAARGGVVGRARSKVCMDDALAEVVLSFEGRPRAEWIIADGLAIDGFVDAWYGDDGCVVGWSSGTNLRQFVDGLALGSGATVVVHVERAGNLHHLYEAVFRALGQAVGESLGLTSTVAYLPGDTSGLAGTPVYTVEKLDTVSGP